ALLAAEAREASGRTESGGRAWDQLWDWLANTATARLQVKKDARVLLDVPFALGLAGAVLAPEAAALSAAACLAGRCDFRLVRSQEARRAADEDDVFFEPEFESVEFDEVEQPH
ncbi:MAG TPA: DUF4342 domain-containing protein, partial [Limnochordia bacterium]|nr:DUF4342 domain-containing protein [Limnochordia bacterium]